MLPLTSRRFACQAFLLSFSVTFKRVTSFAVGKGAASIVGNTIRSSAAVSLQMSKSNHEVKKLGVLALHGSEGNGREFTQRLQALQADALECQGIQLEITALDAPFSKANGFSWWTMPRGVRSFAAEEYEGFDTSVAKVFDIWQTSASSSPPEKPQHSPFDLVVGHSQGAIFLAALLAMDQVPYHPAKGYILNGVAWPNPYSNQLTSLRLNTKGITTATPRVLFVMGERDSVNPVTSAEQLRDGLYYAGFDVATVMHPGGHSFPNQRDETITAITRWLLQDDLL
jgi:predicted esterase